MCRIFGTLGLLRIFVHPSFEVNISTKRVLNSLKGPHLRCLARTEEEKGEGWVGGWTICHTLLPGIRLGGEGATCDFPQIVPRQYLAATYFQTFPKMGDRQEAYNKSILKYQMSTHSCFWYMYVYLKTVNVV